MDYVVQVQNLAAQPLAVVRRRARQADLSTVVPKACGEVWNAIRAGGVDGPGRLVAVYFDGEINLEIGAEVPESFSDAPGLIRSNTPAGLIASTVHVGPFPLLSQAHGAIVQWCRDHGHSLAGPNWEIYGHGGPDPSEQRTDVFYLLNS
jgi:effector-binding domain-containing protein